VERLPLPGASAKGFASYSVPLRTHSLSLAKLRVAALICNTRPHHGLRLSRSMDLPPVNTLPGFIPGQPDVPERYCLRCQARLPTYEGPSRCVACGREFDGTNPLTYLPQREFSPVAFWFPGFFLAVSVGTIACGSMMRLAEVLEDAEPATSILFGLMWSASTLCGYGTRAWGCLLSMLIPLGVLSVIVVGADGGTIMLLVLWIVALTTLTLGLSLGRLLQMSLWLTNWDQRWFLPCCERVLHEPGRARPAMQWARLRRFQFRLSGLFALITGLAVVLTILGALKPPLAEISMAAATISGFMLMLIFIIHTCRD